MTTEQTTVDKNITDKQILAAVRDIPDFPKKGILFKDITPLLGNAVLFKKAVDKFVEQFKDCGITKVVAIESRGFIFGAPLAVALGAGFVPIRKKGKLPYKTYKAEFSLEYGIDGIEIHQDAILPSDKVLLIDDLLATGGTTKAALELIRKFGAKVEACAFLCELGFLKGKEVIDEKVVTFFTF